MSRMKQVFKKVSAVSVLIWLAVLMVLAVGVVLALRQPPVEAGQAIEVPPTLVRVLDVEARPVRETVLLPGRVAANVSARLSAEKGGRVIALLVDKGDVVGAGDVLMRLDERHWKALEQQARLDLADAERDLERWTQMQETGAVAVYEYDTVRLRRDLAVLALEQAAVHVDQCTVASPFDGVVDARWVEIGEYVNEGQAAFSILDLTPLKVLVNLPERDAGVVQVGDRQRMTAPALSGAGVEGRVEFIAQEADRRSLTYAMELRVDDPPAGLRPGMLVDVEVERSMQAGAIAIPLAAVIPRRGENIVFVVENGAAVRRVVVMEAVAGQEALISAGLRAGERLVVEGHRTLQDGMTVQVDEQE